MDFSKQNLRTSVFFEYPEETVEVTEMSPTEVVRMFDHILKAIAYLHKNRMIHGDLKPEYISYSKSENKYILLDRLADVSPPLQC